MVHNSEQPLAFLTYVELDESNNFQIRATFGFDLSTAEYANYPPNLRRHKTNLNIVSVYIPLKYNSGVDFVPTNVIF